MELQRWPILSVSSEGLSRSVYAPGTPEKNPIEPSEDTLYVASIPRSFDGDVNEERERMTQVQETNRLILEAAGEGIYGLDVGGFVTFVNPAARKMTGWSLEDLHSRTQHSIVHHSYPDGSPYPREDCPIYRALRDGQVHHREDEVFWRKDGSCFPVSYTSTPILQSGRTTGAVIVFRDITRQLLDQDWEKSKTQVFSSLLEQELADTIVDRIARAFARYQPNLGVGVHTRSGQYLHLAAHAGLADHLIAALSIIQIDEAAPLQGRVALSAIGSSHTLSTEVHGSLLGALFCLPLLTKAGEVLGTITAFGKVDEESLPSIRTALGQAADLCRLTIEHCALHKQLTYQAQHDALTGLPNRLLLEDRLAQAIINAKRRRSCLGVCFIDLDRFKQINDTLGHGMGDKYLQRICLLLGTASREVDTLARQGGDEFILLLPDLESSCDAQSAAERALVHLQSPFEIDGTSFRATASFGVSVYPDHGDTAATLLQNADTALYAAKRAGRNRVLTYDAALGEEVREHAWISTGLQIALECNQIHLHYQPMMTLKRELQGFEALVRWEHPTAGLITPDRFIPVGEETGLIVPIGAWVLEEACRQAAQWRKEGFPSIKMSVNVSGVQLSQEGFVETVANALRVSGLAPCALQLEITETWIVNDPRAAAARLQTLRDLGVSISVDDFGTGQSSFGCLHELPLDILKIDRSFVARLDGSAKQLSTIRAIVMLAKQLGLSTVAEGVETEEQLMELEKIDCDLIQGFLFARPLSVEQASALLLKPTESKETHVSSLFTLTLPRSVTECSRQ